MPLNNPATAAELTVAETQVYDGNSPTTWTDLDLSSVIGSKLSLVLLKVFFGTPAACAFRKNGDTDQQYNATEADAASGCGLIDGSDSCHKVIAALTDAAGIVEWISEAARANTTVDVIAYVN